MHRYSLFLLSALALFASGCDGSPTDPSDDPVAVIRVGEETFRIRLESAALQAAARAALLGGAASIPNGRIVRGTDVNTGWSWHLTDVAFAEVTIELCDGNPSMVEEAVRAGSDFGGGRFCPWSARVVAIE
jgi:hypothetical protein